VNDRSSSSALALSDVIGVAFPHSGPDTRRALAGAAAVRTFEAGQTIVRQGEESSLALVLDGHVAVRRTTVDGRQLIVRIVARGGLATLLPLAARPAVGDAVALTSSPAALLRGTDVRSLAATDPGLASDILDHVLATYEQTVGRLDGLLHQNALRRVARVLHLHADLFFAEEPVLTRTHLPTLVGTSREMTGRVLRVLESKRLVTRVGRDRLHVLDPAGLALVAGGADAPRATHATRGTNSSS
jgi:CRP-like cAMP-binding protein